MSTKNTVVAAAGLAVLAMSGGVSATDTHTRTISATCMSCHGPGGKSLGPIPSLAGLDQAYFVKAMKDYKSGARIGTIMKRHAAGYTDAEIEAMGAYFAGLK